MIKNTIKHQLSEFGILAKLDFIRRLPEIARWITCGCSGIAPHPVKRMIIASYLKRYGLNCFIETGTHVGDTLADIAYDRSVDCISIELSDDYYRAAKKRFSSYSNVTLMHGDSGVVLPECVGNLDGPALFWLDGHYSGGTTARGKLDTPVSAELQAILESSLKKHVILIDDARCFDGTNTYPQLDELLKTVRQDGNYHTEVSADIIRLTPKTALT